MGRVAIIIGLVAILTATAVAAAAPIHQVRLPVKIATESESADSHPDSVVVEPGDHLWKISERRLGDDAVDEEIAPYWRTVIEVNTPRLRSGNPDLIFPGEVIELPAIPERR